MQSKFDWRGAFHGTGVDIESTQRRLVRDAIVEWNSEWQWESDDGYIIRLEDENCDGIWDIDYDDSDDVDCYLPSDFIRWMDMKFLGRARPKQQVVIGKATKLPIPGARP